MTITARVASLIFNQPLLVLPETAATIATALADRFGVGPLGDIPSAPVTIFKPAAVGPSTSIGGFDASRFVGRPVEQRLGNGDVRQVYRIEDGVALINVHGELVNRGAWIGASSGLTSYEGLDAALRAARDDGGVRAIVLDMNSPGGTASGAMETAALVRQISADKPVVAFVNAMAASAAYAIASGASHIVSLPSAMLGSIGVVWMHLDRSAQMDRSGVKPTILTAGAYKADGHPFAALPDDARARIQGQIDDIYAFFVETVAAHRGLSDDDVRQTEASVFMGRAAVENGLADQVGGLDDVFAFLNRDRARGRSSLGGFMSNREGATGADTPVYTQAQHEAALASAIANARQESAAESRKEVCAAIALLFPDNHRAATFVEAVNDGASVALAAKFAGKIEEPKAAKTHRLDALTPDPKVDPEAPASAQSVEAGLQAACDRLIANLPGARH